MELAVAERGKGRMNTEWVAVEETGDAVVAMLGGV